MVNLRKTLRKLTEERGQSLVEIAIALPIFILIVAGIVEIANLLNTQNKLTTASRIAAGYGAANYDEDAFFDKTALDMGQIALNTITETLELDGDRWDVWSAFGKTNLEGTAFLTTTYRHVFGNNQIVTDAEWSASWPGVQTNMIEELRDEAGCDPGGSDPCPDAADIEVVASVPYFRQEAILGLQISQWANLDKLRGFTVMRVDTKDSDVASAGGCPLLPIAVRVNQWALYPSNWLDQTGEDEDEGPFEIFTLSKQWPEQDVQPFPPFDDKSWEFPACTEVKGSCKADDPLIPEYNDTNMDVDVLVSPEYPVNIPGFPMTSLLNDLDKGKGFVFWAREETVDLGGNFGWLTWNGDPDADKLRDSLDFPKGDFNQFYPGSRADQGLVVNINDYDPDAPNATGLSGDGDGWLEVGEWVEGTPGNKDVAGKQGLEIFVHNPALPGSSLPKSTEVVLIIFDQINENSGSNTNYQVAGFVLAKVLGYSFGGNPGTKDTLFDGKWVVFELIGKAHKCYDPPES